MLLLMFMIIGAPLSLHLQQDQVQSIALNEETAPGPFSGMNEDSPAGSFSEYLHDQQGMIELASTNLEHSTFANDSLLAAGDGRLLSPPPEC